MLYESLKPEETRALARLLVLRRIPHPPLEAVALFARLNRDIELCEARHPGFSLGALFGAKPVGVSTVLRLLVSDGLVASRLGLGTAFGRTDAAAAFEASHAHLQAALDELPLDAHELLDVLACE